MTTTYNDYKYYDDIQSSLMYRFDKSRGVKTKNNKNTKISPKKQTFWQKPVTDFDAIKLFVSPSLFNDREQDNYIKHTKSRRRLVRELDALETVWCSEDYQNYEEMRHQQKLEASYHNFDVSYNHFGYYDEDEYRQCDHEDEMLGMLGYWGGDFY